jgi:hypothetical protein
MEVQDLGRLDGRAILGDRQRLDRSEVVRGDRDREDQVRGFTDRQRQASRDIPLHPPKPRTFSRPTAPASHTATASPLRLLTAGTARRRGLLTSSTDMLTIAPLVASR